VRLVVNLIILLILFSEIAWAGCSSIRVRSNNGIDVQAYSVYPQKDTVYFSVIDTLGLSLTTSGCDASVIAVKINGSAVPFIGNNGITGAWAKLLGIPGRYEVIGSTQGRVDVVYFDLIFKPVGINELNKLAELDITIFPNPADNIVQISCSNEDLESVTINDGAGSTLHTISLSGRSSTIFVESLAPGIYYVHVATRNKRITVKKITIL
jgi:hypothetical protein